MARSKHIKKLNELPHSGPRCSVCVDDDLRALVRDYLRSYLSGETDAELNTVYLYMVREMGYDKTRQAVYNHMRQHEPTLFRRWVEKRESKKSWSPKRRKRSR